MNVKHLITKKVKSGQRRLFFEIHNSHDVARSGPLKIELRNSVLKIHTTEVMVKPIDPKKYGVFYVDVSSVIDSAWRKFDWYFQSRSGRNPKSEKFEDLTE
ncbi:hypothetical protein [Runella sp.]|uniref:hypothetical protein n=1 Tax=Runella sp. TaxID=1960881 RepID=UPI003D124EE5